MAAKIINVADIIEPNGKTIRENNRELTHGIPVGTLVEVQYDVWHGDGACSKVHARLYVLAHNRDCDGTPVYTLGYDPEAYVEYSKKQVNKFTVNALCGVKGGFSESSLTVVPVTPELLKGVGALTWREESC
jgi:hypothetical protein